MTLPLSASARRSPRWVSPLRAFGWILLFVVLSAGCASTGLTLPQGSTAPFRDYQTSFNRATDPCQRVRTMQLAIGINVRTGDTRLRGDLLGALARPASLRLVGVAPFGAPSFILVSEPTAAVLVLPRDQRVVIGATAGDLLETLAGVALDADDFRAVLTGCIVPNPRPIGAKVHENGWIEVSIDAENSAYIQMVDGVPVVIAGRRPDLTVWYSDHVRGLPRRIDLEARDASGVTTVLTATLSQVSINIELNPEVFVAQIRDEYLPMTLDQFRRAPGLLEDPRERWSQPQ